MYLVLSHLMLRPPY